MRASECEQLASGWLSGFLKKRGINCPDGRPLYAYLVDEAEYADLLELVGQFSEVRLANLDACPAFKAAWLLYAAEWWRRCYSGGQWGWSGLFEAAKFTEPPQLQKQDWVLDGRKYWRQDGLLPSARPYLGSVIINGGMPLRLLKESHGALTSLIRVVLRRIGPNARTHYPEILQEVLAQQAILPKTYRNEGIASLLAKLVETLIGLRSEFALDQAENPVQALEQKCPEWRLRFPIRVEADEADVLLKGLVKDVSEVSRRSSRGFVCVRLIRENGQGAWQTSCILEVPTSLEDKVFSDISGISVDWLPQSFELSARSNGQLLAVGRGYVSGGRVRFTLERTDLPDNWFACPVALELSRFGSVIQQFDIPGGSPPDVTQPWVFSDSTPSAKLLRAGSIRLRDDSALLSVPSAAFLLNEMDPAAGANELCQMGGRILYRLSAGEWQVCMHKETYLIRCSDSAAADELLSWHGRRMYVESDPPFVMIGKPCLIRSPATGGPLPVSPDQLFWKPAGETSATSLTRLSQLVGLGSLRWQSQGRIQSAVTAVVLPEGAAIHYLAGADAHEGLIRLKGWPLHAVHLLGPENVAMHVARHGPADWEIALSSEGAPPPASVRLQLNWPGSGIQMVTLPFPSQGVALVDAEGLGRPLGSNLRVQDLLGLRARLLSTNPDASWKMKLSLIGDVGRLVVERTFVYKRLPGSSALQEIRLFELMDIISQMLASVESLDVSVDISFESAQKQYPGFKVGRYGMDLVPDRDRGECGLSEAVFLPSLETLQATHLYALPLLSPQDSARLEPVLSEGVPTGLWRFEPDSRQPGPWLIYPSMESDLPLRPLAWFVPGKFEVTSPLQMCIHCADPVERLSQMHEVFAQMASLPGHPDWQLVEQFVQRVGYLPLSSLDLWVALSRVPAAVVMAHLKVDGFATQISPRFDHELPFEWALTSPSNWLEAAGLILSQFSEEDATMLQIGRFLLTTRLEAASCLPSLLKMTINLALARVQNKTLPEEQLGRERAGALSKGLQQQLLQGESSGLQRLLRRGDDSDERWPDMLNGEAELFVRSCTGESWLEYIKPLRGDFKLSVAVFPILLAREVAADEAARWHDVPGLLIALRSYRQFDPDWFDAAYQCVMQCALLEKTIR